jgi:PAS domain S-box-containing protein
MENKSCPFPLLPDSPRVERRKDSQIHETLMNHSRDIILFIRYQDGRILEANSAAERAYGYSREELLGLTVFDIRAPDSVASARAQLAEAKTRSILFETRHRHRDGCIFPVEVSSKEAIIGGQSVLVSIVRDISQRKKADAALQQSRKRFRSAIDSMPDVVVIYDRDLRIQYVNPATSRVTGRPATDFVGRLEEQVWSEDLVALWRPVLERTLKSAEVQSLDIDFPSPAGLRHLVITCVPMLDVNGRVQEVMSITHDLTARKTAEEALRRSEKRLKTAFEETEKQRRLLDAVIAYAPVGIAILKGPRHRFLRTNAAFDPFVARSGIVVGLSFAEAFPLAAERIVPLLDSVFKTGEPHYTPDEPFEMMRGGIAHEAFFTFIYAPWFNRKGRIGGVMMLAHETTERKRSEDRLKKSLLEKQVLLQEIHHRVKNNMQVINSLMSLQAAKIKDKSLLASFKEATSRVHVMALIHDHLYRSENLSEIDLGSYIKQLTQSVLRMYTAKWIRLKVRTDHIHLDMDQAIPCGLIINELLTNALKYAFPGSRSGVFAIDAFNSDDAGYVTLIISDDGVGLPAEVDFYGTNTLGLKLVHGLVNQLGGTVTAERPEQGTRFTIRFPLQGAG